MDWQGLSRKFASENHTRPQTLARLEVALAQAREALQIMAGHGYIYHLAEGSGTPFPPWPKKLYHVDLSPNGRMVYTEKEAEELGPGWFDTFARAQFWDGLETQFNGRGGIPKTPRVPAPIYNSKSYISEDEARRLSELADFVLKFKSEHKWETGDAIKEPQTAQPDGSGGTQPELREESEDSAESRERVRSSR